jgi:uncharacterized membrane protein YoaK (UPF0700 family)
MTHYDRRAKILAAGLSALAGFVDATGFIALGGFFVSFMSGNTTRFAVGLAQGSVSAAIALGLIGVFVLGVMAGTLVGHFAARRRATSVLMLVALLLALAALLGMSGRAGPAAVVMALAMGAENAIFAHDGEVRIGLTYMTGTLVKFGHHLTTALMGGDRWAWRPYLLLWLGLAGGAVTGALAWRHLGLGNLWLAALIASVFALIAARMPLLAPQPGDLE